MTAKEVKKTKQNQKKKKKKSASVWRRGFQETLFKKVRFNQKEL